MGFSSHFILVLNDADNLLDTCHFVTERSRCKIRHVVEIAENQIPQL